MLKKYLIWQKKFVTDARTHIQTDFSAQRVMYISYYVSAQIERASDQHPCHFGPFLSQTTIVFRQKITQNDYSMLHGVLIKSGILFARIR